MKNKRNAWEKVARDACIGPDAFVCLKPEEEAALIASLPSVVDRETFCAALRPYVDDRTLGVIVGTVKS